MGSLKGEENNVLKLNKVLYEWKKAPQVQNMMIDGFLKHIWYYKGTCEHGIYVKFLNQGNLSIICFYVDYLHISMSIHVDIDNLKLQKRSDFYTTSLRRLKYFLTGVIMLRRGSQIGEQNQGFEPMGNLYRGS